jgi:hypothetical protein
MTDQTSASDPPGAAVDALAALSRAAYQARDTITATGFDRPDTLLETAAMIADLSTFLVERALERVDRTEPGLGEALEQPAEISGDTRRHLLIALNQLAASRAISVTTNRHIRA